MPMKTDDSARGTAPTGCSGVFKILTTRWHRTFEGALIFTAGSLFWSGCTSTSLLAERPEPIPPFDPGQTLVVDLADGRSLELEPFHFVEVREASDFIFGTGKKINPVTGERSTFNGRIDVCDATVNDTLERIGWASVWQLRLYEFAVDETTLVQFKEGDFVTVKASEGPGLWIAGPVNSSASPVSAGRRIDFSSITRVEERGFSPVKTALCVAGAGAVLTVLILGSSMRGFGMGGTWDFHF